MVWACILSEVGDLVFINGQMNKEYFLNMLKGSLCQSAEKMSIVSWFKFYQDNSPKHLAAIIQEWSQ